MKIKFTGLVASALGAGALILGGAATASAATTPTHASAVSARPSIVHPDLTWYYYSTYPTYEACMEAVFGLEYYGAYGGYQCRDDQRTTVDLYQLWVGI
jgi:hypothetical protein